MIKPVLDKMSSLINDDLLEVHPLIYALQEGIFPSLHSIEEKRDAYHFNFVRGEESYSLVDYDDVRRGSVVKAIKSPGNHPTSVFNVEGYSVAAIMLSTLDGFIAQDNDSANTLMRFFYENKAYLIGKFDNNYIFYYSGLFYELGDSSKVIDVRGHSGLLGDTLRSMPESRIFMANSDKYYGRTLSNNSVSGEQGLGTSPGHSAEDMDKF